MKELVDISPSRLTPAVRPTSGDVSNSGAVRSTEIGKGGFPVGWRCPVCGGVNAPLLAACPCSWGWVPGLEAYR